MSIKQKLKPIEIIKPPQLTVIVNPKPAINNSKLPVSCRYAELLAEREFYGH